MLAISLVAAYVPHADAATITPTAGTGLIVDSFGTDDCCPYTTDIEITTTFSDTRVEPGEPFSGTYRIRHEITGNSDDTCEPPVDPPEDSSSPIMSWALYKVPPGGSQHSEGSERTSNFTVTGTEEQHSDIGCESAHRFVQIYDYEYDFTVPADEVPDLKPGCYHSPVDQSLSGDQTGTVAILGVGTSAASCMVPQCADSLNNDFDGPPGFPGLIDFPDDPGCTSSQDPTEVAPVECDNGVDDDGDGLIDWPAEPGCVDPTDPAEALFECSDGLNNDFDAGLIDMSDPSCASPEDPSELGEAACDNGVDDDNDGRTDWPSDRACGDPIANAERNCFGGDVVYEAKSGWTGNPWRPLGVFHTTSLHWCAEPGDVHLTGPVSSGAQVGDVWSEALREELGELWRVGPDWRPPEVHSIPGGLMVQTYPTMDKCIDIGTVVSYIPLFRSARVWRALPRATRVKIVGNGVGAWLYLLRHNVYVSGELAAVMLRGLGELLEEMKAQLIQGRLGIICRQDVHAATVTIRLDENGFISRKASMKSGRTGASPAEEDVYWIESATTKTQVLPKVQSGTAPKPNGDIVVVFNAPSRGTLKASARRTGATSSSSRNATLGLVAKGRRKVAAPGVVRVTLKPTRAGKALVRRKGSAKVSIEIDFVDGASRHTRRTIAGDLGVPRRNPAS